jgi:cyanophycinase-like exopeptidase
VYFVKKIKINSHALGALHLQSAAMMNRRSLLCAGTATGVLWSPVQALSESRRVGRLVIIGGAEDRLHDKYILSRFVELCGGAASRIRILSAASEEPASSWATY